MNKWDDINYQKILETSFHDGDLIVRFLNGDKVDVRLENVLPVGTIEPDVNSITNTDYEVLLKASSSDVVIPWDRIRILSDTDFAQEMAKKAEENSRLVGKRLKALRERKNIKNLELAERAGVTAQTISRIEKGHTDVGFATLRKILAAMGYTLKDLATEEIAEESNELQKSFQSVLKRLSKIGIDSSILDRILPADLKTRLSIAREDLPELVQSEISAYLSRVFDWRNINIWGTEELTIKDNAARLAYFKTPSKGNINQIKAYSHYAYFLANSINKINVAEPKKEYPGDLENFKMDFYNSYSTLTLEHLLNFSWDLGISVLPLSDQGIFHGASWNINEKHVIVLKQRTDSHAKWIFDLLHELYHVFAHLEKPNTSVVETEELNPFGNTDSPEEMEANSFANQFLFENRSEELVLLILNKAEYRIDRLKKAVFDVASSEKVQADFLANYLAFRLQMNGHNWWGTANSFQITSPSPFALAAEVLKNRVAIQSLNPIDRNLVNSALNQ